MIVTVYDCARCALHAGGFADTPGDPGFELCRCGAQCGVVAVVHESPGTKVICRKEDVSEVLT